MAAPLTEAVRQSVRGRRSTRRLTMSKRKSQDELAGDLAQALQDAVNLFRELGIGYALIGGLAAMVHGRSRYTEDVDFVADPGHDETLASHPDVMEKHRFDPSCTWKLYHRSGVTIDLWKDEHAAGIVKRAVRRKLGNRFAKVAEPHDLVAMKLRADRPQDDYDIAQIIAAQDLDSTRLKPLVTAAQFRRFTAIGKRVARAD
ncbi:MAG: hypothetical protein AAGL98_04890 [Planctomycetota bacterium]